MSWEIAERPGYFGMHRDEIFSEYDASYGKGNWRISWQWGKDIIQKQDALQLYEDGYYEFFRTNRSVLDWLILNFSDVYDTDPSNIKSLLNYNIQETPNNHIQDIAIRRAVFRYGLRFVGKELVHIRPGEKGERLGPHLIPFHIPHMIYRGATKYKGKERDFVKEPPWWIKLGIKDSVEEFYQQNKVLEIKV